jgi:serine/threonine-protein kinase
MPEMPSQQSEREQRLERVLAEYLHAVEAGQPPGRAELLARHPNLADELASFLRNREALEGLTKPLQEQDAAEPPTVGPEQSPEANALLHSFGDYELLGEINRGGMGVVFKARQRSLNRLVALKMILKGELATAADVQRFRTEAEAAANLEHPNIVPIYEVGEHQGQPYFAMKLIDGGSLAGRLEGLGR